MERFYLPILKAKGGEFTALSKINFTQKSWVCPLFEITKIEYDLEENGEAPTLQKHLDNLCKKIIKCWPYDHAFIDAHLVKDDRINNLSSLEYIYKTLADKQIYPVPIARIDSSKAILTGIINIIEKYPVRNIAIRITIEDVDSPDFEIELENILLALKTTAAQCHLIFDLMDSNFSETENFSDGVIGIFERFPMFLTWKTFTLVGGAFPATGKLKEGVQKVMRGDWNLYKAVLKKMKNLPIERSVNFGDYSIVAPGHFVFDPIKMQSSANIRYTLDEEWLVVKGKSLKTTGFDQYYGCASNIVGSGHFLGEHYSSGDTHLLQCSKKLTKTGNQQVWNWVGNNHHFAKVINDLFSNPSGF